MFSLKTRRREPPCGGGIASVMVGRFACSPPGGGEAAIESGASGVGRAEAESVAAEGGGTAQRGGGVSSAPTRPLSGTYPSVGGRGGVSAAPTRPLSGTYPIAYSPTRPLPGTYPSVGGRGGVSTAPTRPLPGTYPIAYSPTRPLPGTYPSVGGRGGVSAAPTRPLPGTYPRVGDEAELAQRLHALSQVRTPVWGTSLHALSQVRTCGGRGGVSSAPTRPLSGTYPRVGDEAELAQRLHALSQVRTPVWGTRRS